MSERAYLLLGDLVPQFDGLVVRGRDDGGAGDFYHTDPVAVGLGGENTVVIIIVIIIIIIIVIIIRNYNTGQKPLPLNDSDFILILYFLIVPEVLFWDIFSEFETSCSSHSSGS